MKIHWPRVVIGAFLIEVVLFVVLIPLGMVLSAGVNLVVVPIGCFVAAFLITAWLCRRIQSRLVLHGFLMGLLATLIYLGLVVGGGQTSAAMDIYGPFLFVLFNVIRIAGAVAGGMYCERRLAPQL